MRCVFVRVLEETEGTKRPLEITGPLITSTFQYAYFWSRKVSVPKPLHYHATSFKLHTDIFILTLDSIKIKKVFDLSIF